MEKELELKTSYGETLKVQLEISQYANNGCIYVGVLSKGEEGLEPYENLTVNLRDGAPDYCGYIDTNNMPEAEEFLRKNDLGYFTGLVGRSGFSTYPTSCFNVAKLTELCPEGMAAYAASIEPIREPQNKEHSR